MLRALLPVLCLGLFGAVGLIHPASSQELRIASMYKPGSDARDRATRIFMEEVQLRAPELKFTIVGVETLGAGPAEQFAGLVAGRTELAVFPLAYGAEKVPELALPGLPGLVPGVDAAQKLKGSDMHRKLQAVAEKAGFRILSWWWVIGGFVSIDRQILGPDTVKDLKIKGDDRQFEAMLKSAGALPQNVAMTASNGAMKAGTLQALATSYESLMSNQLYDAAKFATVGGWTIWNSFSPLMMSKAAWDKLSPAQKELFEAAADVADAYFDASQRDAERRVVTRFDVAGAKVKSLTPDEWEDWVVLAQKTTWLDYLKVSPASADLLRSTLLKIMEDDREPSKGDGK